MNGVYYLIPAVLALLVMFLVVRGASIALMMTGMDRERAKFQALSAFSGTGFTTSESESIVNHPKRRKIATWLMVAGNAGIIAVIVTTTSSLVTSRGVEIPVNSLIFIAAAIVVYRVATSRGLLKRWDVFVEERLVRSKTFENVSTEDLLHFGEGYGLVREIVCEGSLVRGRSLADSRLSQKGLLVLGIERGPRWIPIPSADTVIERGDRLVVYGPLMVLKALLGDTEPLEATA